MSIKTFLKSRPSRTKVDPLIPSHICVYFSPIDYPLSQAVSSQWTALNATTAVAGFGWNGGYLRAGGGIILSIYIYMGRNIPRQHFLARNVTFSCAVKQL